MTKAAHTAGNQWSQASRHLSTSPKPTLFTTLLDQLEGQRLARGQSFLSWRSHPGVAGFKVRGALCTAPPGTSPEPPADGLTHSRCFPVGQMSRG